MIAFQADRSTGTHTGTSATAATIAMPERFPPPAATWRGRFAPSPTGPLHFGSLIAALGSFLEARVRGGEWLLRMEDLDTPRVVSGAAGEILTTLEAFGLTWDGPVLYQSRRQEAYQQALEGLMARGLVYTCTCSRREVARRAAMGPGGMIYPGSCRTGPGRPGRPGAIRLRVSEAEVTVADPIQGPLTQHLGREVGDFVIRRADGLFAYQLAVVVDDAFQQIDQVVRGSDLWSSTPRQIHLQAHLKLPTPSYTHLPVAVDRRGDKLSKQTHAPPLDSRRPAPALVAALAFLGQQPPPELVRAAPREVLAWAIAHWYPARIPRRERIRWTPPF